MNKKVLADFKILKHQRKVIESNHQYVCLVGGYGSGKTDTGIIHFLNLMEENGLKTKRLYNKKYILAVYEPTYNLIRDILYEKFETTFDFYNIKYKLNKSTNEIWIPKFNTKIMMRSMDNESKIVGYEIHDFWLDELDILTRDKAERVWKLVVARSRAVKENDDNSGLVTTTPEGFKFVYSKFGKIKKEDEDTYKLIRASTYDNIFLKPKYVAGLERQYDSKLVKAYLLGYFINLKSSTVYYNFNRKKNKTKLIIEDFPEDEILHVGMDFNVEHMSAVVSVNNSEDNELYILKEFKDILDTPNMIRILKEEFPDRILRIYPDASSVKRSSSDASKSDLILLKREKNFQVVVDTANPRVKDRVISVNTLFENSRNEINLFINIEKCTELVENLEQQVYDKRTGEPDKSQGQDHIIDALGYVVDKLYPIRRQLSKNFNR